MKNKVKEYLAYLKHERNMSPNTITAYQLFLTDFTKFIEEKNVELGNIDHKKIRAHLAELKERGNCKNSLTTKLGAISAFFKYCEKKGYVEDNPATVMSAPKFNRKLPSFLSESEEEIFLTVPFLVLRDTTILQTFCSTGIRLAELVGINIDDIDYEKRVIKVLGKGGRERLSPYGLRLKRILKYYLWMREVILDEDSEEKALFISHRRERISMRAVQRIFEKCNSYLELDKKISPHSLRHGYASHMLSRGAGLREIQELLGHESIVTTEKYTHVSPNQLIKNYRKASLRNDEQSQDEDSRQGIDSSGK